MFEHHAYTYSLAFFSIVYNFLIVQLLVTAELYDY